MRLFDKSNGELLSTYKGHTNQKYKVDSTLTNNDAYVIGGSEDGSVCFWDLVEVRDVACHVRGERETNSIPIERNASQIPLEINRVPL